MKVKVEQVGEKGGRGPVEEANGSCSWSWPNYMWCGMGANVGLAAGGRQASVAEQSD